MLRNFIKYKNVKEVTEGKKIYLDYIIYYCICIYTLSIYIVYIH